MGLFSTSIGYFVFAGLHVVCFALALAVCGLYGQDLNKAHHEDKYADSKWVSHYFPLASAGISPSANCAAFQVYAVVVGSLSAITCVVYFVPLVLHRAGIVAAVWNTLLFILWITLFGVFGAVSEIDSTLHISTGYLTNSCTFTKTPRVTAASSA